MDFPKADWQSEDGAVRLYRGDCLEVMASLPVGCVDAVNTDPPYLTGDAQVPIRGAGVSKRLADTFSVGMPWGYSLDWMDAAARLCPSQWFVFVHYKMLGGVGTKLEQYAEVSALFSWLKRNASRMTRPVPRFDIENIFWARAVGASCKQMGDFDSLLIDIPNLQAGCFATERILMPGSGKAAHPCQKPEKVMRLFVERGTSPGETVLDPFMGSGTCGVACAQTGRRFIGIEQDPAYFEIAVKRISDALAQPRLFTTDETRQPERQEALAL